MARLSKFSGNLPGINRWGLHDPMPLRPLEGRGEFLKIGVPRKKFVHSSDTPGVFDRISCRGPPWVQKYHQFWGAPFSLGALSPRDFSRVCSPGWKSCDRLGWNSQDRHREDTSTKIRFLKKILSGIFWNFGPKDLWWRKVKFWAQFWGLTKVLALCCKLQKVIILGVPMASFGFFWKSLTILEFLRKGHFAPPLDRPYPLLGIFWQAPWKLGLAGQPMGSMNTI